VLTISCIGAGNMGSALVRGLIQSGTIQPGAVKVFDIDPAKTFSLHQDFGVQALDRLQDSAADSETVLILAVKPQVLGGVLDTLADVLHEGMLVISIAAGISTGFILTRLGKSIRLVRAMPNAAATVGRSVTAICKGGAATDEDLALASSLFSAIGYVVKVDESLMNAVTALASSGLGYLFVIMEALSDAGVLLGMDRQTARHLTVHMVRGAAVMASSSDAPFSALKDMITSPAGTTIAGLKVLEKEGLRGILMEAVEAANARAALMNPKQ